VAQACAPAMTPVQGTCSDGNVCAPHPDTGYHICVAQSIDTTCPASSGYAVKRIAYKSATDTRDCGACTCGAAGGGSCSATLNLVQTCNSTTGTGKSAPFSCNLLVDIGTTAVISQGGPQGVTCPGTTPPTGGVQPASPTTFCCLD